MNKQFLTFFRLLAIIPLMARAIDNHHFYRASNFFTVYNQPRLEECWLTSFDVTVAGGSTRDSYNGCGSAFNLCDTHNCLLNICGYYNMPALACGLPNLDASNPVDQAMLNLSNLVDACSTSPITSAPTTFGMLSYAGKFSIFEANFFFTQNFRDGFFFQAHIPVRQLKITDIRSADLSPTDPAIVPNINTAQWQAFLGIYDDLLTQYSISLCPIKRTGAGDLSLLLGWTINYENTEILDFIDLTFRAGMLAPTGKKARANCAFDLPTGYNGHYGIPMSFDLALGAFDCFTLGFHMDALPFIDSVQCLRVHTSPNQEGLLKLQQIKAKVHEGLVWGATGYLQADRFIFGFSMLLGFTIAKKKSSYLDTAVCFCDGTLVSPQLTYPSSYCIDCDLVNGGWTMETLHLLFEYDFAHCWPSYAPHVGIFYNGAVGGSKIFKTGMIGGAIGFDF